MSWTALLEYEAACAQEAVPEPPLEWLLAMLKQSMEELMAGEAPPLQKANAAARLGNLFLKTCRASELEKENKALKQRLAELESALADTVDRDAAPPDVLCSLPPGDAPEAALLRTRPPCVKEDSTGGRQTSRSRSRGQPAKHHARQHR